MGVANLLRRLREAVTFRKALPPAVSARGASSGVFDAGEWEPDDAAERTDFHGAWVRNAAEEAQMVETMRKSSDLVVKSESARGTKTSDTYSLKGIGQALDKVAEECK